MRISDWSSDVCSSDLIDPEAALVIAGLRLAQPPNPLGRRIAVRVRLSRHLAQLFDHMRRRRQAGIAPAEVDDVLAPRSRRCPPRVHFVDDIRWQASNKVKFLGPRSEEHTSALHKL